MKKLSFKKIVAMALIVGVIVGQNLVYVNASTVSQPITPVTTPAPQPIEPVVTPTPTPVKPVVKPVPQRNVLTLVKPSIVYATMLKNEGGFSKGQKVEIIMDRGNGTTYKIISNRKTGWVGRSALNIPKDPATNMDKLTKVEKERFANVKGFSSNSRYFVWVDIDRQVLNVFTGSKGKWILTKSIDCSTGTNKTPTLRGTNTLKERGSSFGSYNTLGAKYWVRYSGNYLIHSLPYQYGKITDYTLGKRSSHGCVRVSVANSQWIYKTLPSGTVIWTN